MKNVVVCGSYDVLHDGHLYFLGQSKQYGDLLYVALAPDEIILQNKSRQPRNTLSQRAKIMRRIDVVDVVIELLQGGSPAIEEILRIPPHVYCFGHDQRTPWDIELESRLRQSDVEVRTIRPYNRDTLSSTKSLEMKLNNLDS